MEKGLNKRELQAMETRERLLNTSKELIIKEGYDNVSISQICKSCKVAKASFYTYFESKRDILIEILAEVNHRMFDGKVWNESLNSIEQLMEYVDCYMQTIKEQGVDFSNVFLRIILEEDFEAEAVGADKHQQLTSNIINNGKAKGEIRADVPTEKLCRYLQGFIYGIIISWCKNSEKYDIVKEGNSDVRVFLDMMKP